MRTGVLPAHRTKKKIIMRERRVRESGLKLGKQGATCSTTFMDNGRASPGLPSMSSILLTQHSFTLNEENRLLVTVDDFEK